MAGICSEIIIKSELRPCTVNGEKALFHKWSDVSEIRQAMLRGSVSGVLSDTFGIVEFENGTIKRVHPHEIHFCDNKIDEYCFEAVKNQKGNNNDN